MTSDETPAEKAVPIGQPITFRQGVLYFSLPLLAWLLLSLGISQLLSLRLTFWLALPLGFLIGAFVVAVFIHAQGASTVVELNIASLILLILLLILWPVFSRLRHPHHRHPHTLAKRR